MKWTKTPPTVPGLWWVRCDGGTAELVELFMDNKGILRVEAGDYPSLRVDEEYPPKWGHEWAGPILPPEETR